jgi:ATP synthase protein I
VQRCVVIGAIGAQAGFGVSEGVERTGYFRIIPRFAVNLDVLAGVLVSERKIQPGARAAWDDEAAEERIERLTPAEAAAFRARNPQVSPWRVIAAQAGVGGVVALLAWLLGGGREHAWSALYGAVTAVVPGALLARGMTSRLTSLSPAVSAVGVMVWEMVKIGATVALLIAAPQLVRPLSWPALLAALAACLSVYWFALLWRGRKS